MGVRWENVGLVLYHSCLFISSSVLADWRSVMKSRREKDGRRNGEERRSYEYVQVSTDLHILQEGHVRL